MGFNKINLLIFMLAALFSFDLWWPAVVTGEHFNEFKNLGDWSEDQVEAVFHKNNEGISPGEKIAYISSEFLDTPYTPGTMVGSNETPEALVIRFDSVDCFTLLDYVEALRRATSFSNFRSTLIATRYKRGQVDYLSRNHFFTDWIWSNSEFIVDMTRHVGGDLAVSVDKRLNLKGDGVFFLDGYPVQDRRIYYIAADAMFFISFFVLGGDFWDKFRHLFIQS